APKVRNMLAQVNGLVITHIFVLTLEICGCWGMMVDGRIEVLGGEKHGWYWMAAPWVVDEMKTADLGDKRITERLKQLLSELSCRPTLSIPAACGGRAEMTAAYRFFDNQKATFENILRPHGDATRKRMAAERVVVLAQDTTEIEMTKPE